MPNSSGICDSNLKYLSAIVFFVPFDFSFFPLMLCAGRAKMKELLAGLKEVGNEGRQMEALVELCEVRRILQHFFLDESLTDLAVKGLVHGPRGRVAWLQCRFISPGSYEE